MTTEEGAHVDLANSAIAAFADDQALARAMAAVESSGLDYSILVGETGRASLQPKQEGIAAALQRLAATFGDEMRIIDELDRSLAKGDRILLVEIGDLEEDKTPQVVDMLREAGGRFLWQFRGWTFHSAGTAD